MRSKKCIEQNLLDKLARAQYSGRDFLVKVT